MPLLRSILFETHTAHLKGLTHAACYMRYRLAKRERYRAALLSSPAVANAHCAPRSLVEHERKRFASIARGLI